MMVAVYVRLHRLGHLVWIFEVDGHHAQIIADELDQVVVGLDTRKAAEQAALVRIVQMRLQCGGAILAKKCEELEQQGQEIKIVAVFPARALEAAYQALPSLPDRVHRIRNDERAE